VEFLQAAAAVVQNHNSAHKILTVTWMNISSFAGSALLRKGVFLQPLCNQYVDHAEVTPHTVRVPTLLK
jgi:ABC-type microcin C transport system permease subunit YejB